MNRKAKRNKYRNTLASKDVEINTLKNEVHGYANAYILKHCLIFENVLGN